MAIRPGTLDTFGGSMAAAIEAELDAMLFSDGQPHLLNDGSAEVSDRRRLFVAIARGVVRHLSQNPADLKVPYLDDGVTQTTNVNMVVDLT